MKRIIFCLLLAGTTTQLFAQNYQAHAVYMYSFIKYIQWPEPVSEGDFVIGVLGDSEIVGELEKMASIKKAGSSNIIIKTYSRLAETTNMEMLFISKNVEIDMTQVLGKFAGTQTLIITEQEGLGLEGSNINFVEREGKLAFELNKQAMDREKLKVSTELTRLAKII